MADAGAVLLTQTDGQHLHDAAFKGAVEVRMGLNAGHRHNIVTGECKGIQTHIQSLGRNAHLLGLHGSMDLAAAGLFRNAVVVQNGTLAFCSRTTMAAHGRHDIRLGADALEFLGKGPQDQHTVGNLTAGSRETNRAAGLNPVQSALALERVAHSLRYILNMGIVHLICDFVKLRDLNVLEQILYNAHF